MDVFPGSLPMPEDDEGAAFPVGELAGAVSLLAPEAGSALVYDAGSGGLFLDLGTGEAAIPLAVVVGAPPAFDPVNEGW